MRNLDGFQVAITCWLDDDEVVVVINNLTVAETAELTRQWARPNFLRRGKGLTALTDDGEEVFVKWGDIIDLRSQPQVEATP